MLFGAHDGSAAVRARTDRAYDDCLTGAGGGVLLRSLDAMRWLDYHLHEFWVLDAAERGAAAVKVDTDRTAVVRLRDPESVT